MTKKEIYEEFEGNLRRIFGFSIDRFKEYTRDEGEIDKQFEEDWLSGGKKQLRHAMGIRIACLDYILMNEELGREGTFEEFCDRVEELDIGLTRDDLVPFKHN